MDQIQPKKAGRPTVVTPEVIDKLEAAYAMGCTDIEACLYANISRTTLNEYMEKNPDFRTRREELKEQPVLLARKTVYDQLDNLSNAQWYLERKNKAEFSTRVENDLRVKELPKPIIDVPENNGHQENNGDDSQNTGSARGNISEQVDLDPALPDSESTTGQEINPDLDSVGIFSTLEEGSDEGLSTDPEGT